MHKRFIAEVVVRPATPRRVVRAAFLVVVLATGGACLAGTSLAPPVVSDPAVRDRQREQWAPVFEKEARVQDVLWSLRMANAALCGNVAPKQGFFYLDKATFDEAKHQRVFKYPLSDVENEGVVQHVAAGSPAWNAGMRPGDRWTMELSPRPSRWTDPPQPKIRGITYSVRRSGQAVEIGPFNAAFVCAAESVIIKSEAANALTDGRQIGITSGMLDFVRNDHELAFVLAHELAHTALDHISKRKKNAVWGAIFGGVVDGLANCRYCRTGESLATLGAAAFSKDFEREADYLGMYMMARAGFDPDSVSVFWARSSGDAPPVWGTTHPVDAERELNAAIYADEIATKRLNGEELRPNRKGG